MLGTSSKHKPWCPIRFHHKPNLWLQGVKKFVGNSTVSVFQLIPFQGIFLAILYCFLNSEVQEAVKRQVQRNSTRNDIFRETRGDSFKHRLNRRRETNADNQVRWQQSQWLPIAHVLNRGSMLRTLLNLLAGILGSRRVSRGVVHIDNIGVRGNFFDF